MFCTGCSNVKYLKFPDARTHFRDLTSATRMKFIAQRFLSSVIKEHHFLVPSETMPRALPPPLGPETCSLFHSRMSHVTIGLEAGRLIIPNDFAKHSSRHS